MKIYLIGGVTYDKELYEYFERTAAFLRAHGHKVLVPKLYPGGILDVNTVHSIYAYSKMAINWANITYVDFNDVEYTSVERVAELAQAHYAGKHTVASVREHTPEYEYYKLLENTSDVIFKTHDQAMKYICNLRE